MTTEGRRPTTDYRLSSISLMQRLSGPNLIWNTLVEAYYNMAELVVLNLLWLLLTFPLVTAPAALGGLYYATNQMANHQPFNWRMFFTGFKQCFWLSLKWALVNILVYAVLWANYRFYEQLEGGWTVWMQAASLSAGFMWLLLQIYTYPVLMEQKDRRLRVALRNSLVLYLKRPGPSLTLALTLLALAFLSTWLKMAPWVILSASLMAYLANVMTVALLKEVVE